MLNNFYENNKFILFTAVSKSFTNDSVGRDVQKWELEHIDNVRKAYSKEIRVAKELIEQDDYYKNLEIHDKIELATWITEYLYEEKEQQVDKQVAFRWLV